VSAKRREPRRVEGLVAETVQFDLISTHGGMPGLRDEHALESARASWLRSRMLERGVGEP
jgi:hypothetical protein